MFITEPSASGALCPSTGFAMPCMGSTCLMGWRWQSNATMEIGITKDKNPPPGEGWEMVGTFKGNGGGSWRRPWTVDRKGYCGIAGEPKPIYNAEKFPAEKEE